MTRRVASISFVPDEYVVSLQNGLEEPKIARAVGAERTVGAFITVGAHYVGPGKLFFGGPGGMGTLRSPNF